MQFSLISMSSGKNMSKVAHRQIDVFLPIFIPVVRRSALLRARDGQYLVVYMIMKLKMTFMGFFILYHFVREFGVDVLWT